MVSLDKIMDTTSAEPHRRFLSFSAFSPPQQDQPPTVGDPITGEASPLLFNQFLDRNSGAYANSHGDEIFGVHSVTDASEADTDASYAANRSERVSLSPVYGQLDSSPSTTSTHHATCTDTVSACPVAHEPQAAPSPTADTHSTLDSGSQHCANFSIPTTFAQPDLYGIPPPNSVQHSSPLAGPSFASLPVSAFESGMLHYGHVPQETFTRELDEPPVLPARENSQCEPFAGSGTNVDGLWELCLNEMATQTLASFPRYNQRTLENVVSPAEKQARANSSLVYAAVPTSYLTLNSLNFAPVSGPSPAYNHSAESVSPGHGQYTASASSSTEYRASMDPVGWAPETETQSTQPLISAEGTGEEFALPDHPPLKHQWSANGSATFSCPNGLSSIHYQSAMRKPSHGHELPHRQIHTYPLDPPIFSQAFIPSSLLSLNTYAPGAPKDSTLPQHPAHPVYLTPRLNKRSWEDDEPAEPSKCLHPGAEVKALALSPSLDAPPAPKISENTLTKRLYFSSQESAPVAGPSDILPPPAGPSTTPASLDIQSHVQMATDESRITYPTATFTTRTNAKQTRASDEAGGKSGFPERVVGLGDAANRRSRKSNRNPKPQSVCEVGGCGEPCSDYSTKIRHFVKCVRKNDKEHIRCLNKMPLRFFKRVWGAVPRPECDSCGKDFSRMDAVARHKRESCGKRSKMEGHKQRTAYLGLSGGRSNTWDLAPSRRPGSIWLPAFSHAHCRSTLVIRFHFRPAIDRSEDHYCDGINGARHQLVLYSSSIVIQTVRTDLTPFNASKLHNFQAEGDFVVARVPVEKCVLRLHGVVHFPAYLCWKGGEAKDARQMNRFTHSSPSPPTQLDAPFVNGFGNAIAPESFVRRTVSSPFPFVLLENFLPHWSLNTELLPTVRMPLHAFCAVRARAKQLRSLSGLRLSPFRLLSHSVRLYATSFCLLMPPIHWACNDALGIGLYTIITAHVAFPFTVLTARFTPHQKYALTFFTTVPRAEDNEQI
ncbi:hypothetical protein K488DRAFT_73361 [Vararia minispora EC-137]|uniref:Uncharacterized protein n=1 Tax=Vararia minispora EC-137 TaxID=1314806 RepID=A0ACB8QAS7_9AGAM|nr:hypothetical protein K488DRAFT_73361 [Vararia minispora EC-137]